MRFPQQKQARVKIRCRLADTQDYKTRNLQNQILYILRIDVNHSFK